MDIDPGSLQTGENWKVIHVGVAGTNHKRLYTGSKPRIHEAAWAAHSYSGMIESMVY